MRESWSCTFTSELGPYSDNSFEIGSAVEDESDDDLVCIVTSKDGFYCRPYDLARIIERLQKIYTERT